ncbi:hypothetical protein Z946_3844 [Sulfitobacter noctilucicola]|nr:hypothetical protein Z946_3844 [Sulfitobacter noctilucicola]
MRLRASSRFFSDTVCGPLARRIHYILIPFQALAGRVSAVLWPFLA